MTLEEINAKTFLELMDARVPLLQDRAVPDEQICAWVGRCRDFCEENGKPVSDGEFQTVLNLFDLSGA